MTAALVKRCLCTTLLLISPSAAALAAESGIAQQRDQLACGNTLVTAQASCYAGTPMCVRETLSFRRPEGSTIIATHKHLVSRELPGGGRTVEVLDYRISAWSCVAGVNGGRYLALIMASSAGGDCKECEFLRLYHPNGRVIGSTVRFDAAGRPHEDARSGEVIQKVIGKPAPEAFRPLYPK